MWCSGDDDGDGVTVMMVMVTMTVVTMVMVKEEGRRTDWHCPTSVLVLGLCSSCSLCEASLPPTRDATSPSVSAEVPPLPGSLL